MSIYDRWHTKKPKRHPETGEPITCEHKADGTPMYPSADHGKGDRWQVRWRDPDGNQCKRNFPRKAGKNPAVHAEAYYKKIMGELATGAYVDPAEAEVTLATRAARWRKQLTGKPNKLEVIDRRLAYIYDTPSPGDRRQFPGTSTIGRRSLRELERRPELIQEWIKDLEARGLSPQYITHIVDTLSSIFVGAIENGIVSRNPVRSSTVQAPQVLPRHVQPWTLKQIRLASESLADAQPRLATMPDLGAAAGLRISEIFGFAEEDLALQDGTLRVARQVVMEQGTLIYTLPKFDKTREVPMGEKLRGRLERQIAEHPAVEVTLPWLKPGGEPRTFRLLYVRPEGQPFYRRVFDLLWVVARAAAGAPATRANGSHALRHTYASACLAGGVDIGTLADWLGHVDPGFTLRTYRHLMPSAASRGRAAIDEFFEDL